MSSALAFEGSNVLVSGAAGGIGGAVATILGGLGANVILSDAVPCRRQADAIRTKGGRASDLPCDVTKQEQVAGLARAAGDLDAVVLAAGRTSFMPWSDPGFEDDLDRLLDINFRGVVRMAKSLLPAMYARGRGRLVLVGSVAAWSGGTLAGVGPHYAASKGAVHTLVRWLARDAAPHNVTVNGIAPGPTDTAMTKGQDLSAIANMPLKRLATPEEIAWPIVFLCSSRSSFMTGAIMDVNGGAYMR